MERDSDELQSYRSRINWDGSESGEEYRLTRRKSIQMVANLVKNAV